MSTRPTLPLFQHQTLISIAFFLSGAAGLIYQVVWMRRLVTILGVTSHAVSVSLAVYMTGLALGSFLFGRSFFSRCTSLWLYGMLEVGIGLSGLLTIPLLEDVPGFYANAARDLSDGSMLLLLIRVVAAGSCLLVPTIFMGATLPAVSRVIATWARSESDGAHCVARLYAANTFGAVVGTITTAMYLIFHFGLNGATAIAAVLNFAAACLAITLVRFVPKVAAVANVPSESGLPNQGMSTTPFLFALFLSGFISLAFEVIWTRYLTYVLHTNSVYAFASMLAAFLTGIALGSMIVSRRLATGRKSFHPERALFYCFFYAAVSSLISAPMMAFLVGRPSGGEAFAIANLLMFLKCVLVLLVPTTLSGAIFALILDLTSSNLTLSTDTGKAYAINTIGCIFGALAGSFLFLPLFGVQEAIIVLSGMYLLGALIVGKSCGSVRALVLSRQGFIAATVLAIVIPLSAITTDPFILRHVPPGSSLLFYENGAESSVGLVQVGPGNYNFIVDTDVQASTAPSGSLSLRLMGHIPALLHPQPKRALIICLGTGITAASILMHPIEELDIVELSPAVPKLQDLLKEFNHGAIHDPRVRLIRDDGRNFLLRTSKQYDLISTDPLDPDDAGMTLLYSKEFYELINQHLAPGGIVAQWLPPLPSGLGPQGAYRTHIRTFRSAFPNTSIWEADFSSVIVGLQTPVQVNSGELERRYLERNVGEDLARSNIMSYDHFQRLFIIGAASVPKFVGEGPITSDTYPFVEYLTLRDHFPPEQTEDPFVTIKSMREPDMSSFVPR